MDASAVVALLTAEASVGDWVADMFRGCLLAAPELMPFEVSNILRRQEQARLLDGTAALLAHHDLLDLTVQHWPYLAVAGRAWELRPNLTAYDASYVALAELIGAPLVTLDMSLRRASSVSCEIRTPPEGPDTTQEPFAPPAAPDRGP